MVSNAQDINAKVYSPDRLRLFDTRLLRSFLSDRKVGSVCNSSTAVADRVVAHLVGKPLRVVVELGPGSGAITRRALDVMPSQSTLVAIEQNAFLAEGLKADNSDPRLRVICGNALDLTESMRVLELKADAIIAGIPLTYLSNSDVEIFFEAMHASLNPGGFIVMYQAWLPLFLPRKQTFKHALSKFRLTQSDYVVANFPPLVVLHFTDSSGIVNTAKSVARSG